MWHHRHAAKEASECMQDSAGRWFPFRVKLDTVFVLEKKNLPEHVGKLDVVEQPTTFAHLLRALEDAGEVLAFVLAKPVHCWCKIINRG